MAWLMKWGWFCLILLQNALVDGRVVEECVLKRETDKEGLGGLTK